MQMPKISSLAMYAAASVFLLAPVLSIWDVLPDWIEDTGPDSWNEEERRILASLQLSQLPPLPADPSNAVEGKLAAVNLGKQLFFDARMSKNESVSCATCHDPKLQFQDGKPIGQGITQGKMRTMPLGAVAYSPFLFWDGRKDSLWSQALSPLEDKAEQGNTRLGLAHFVASNYKNQYETLFNKMPNLDKLPQDASPLGSMEQQDAWMALPKQARHEISQVFANIGKAIAAYEKTLQFGPARLDRYIDGVLHNKEREMGLLSASEKNGLRLFIGKAQCITCHNGPLLTDGSFHNTGVRDKGAQLQGRAAAVTLLQQDPFNCLGPFSDAKTGQCHEMRFLNTDNPAWLGAFKTPSLRGVTYRAPYMHNGQMGTLEMVANHYQKAQPALLGHNERDPMQLSPSEITDLVAFMHSLDSKVIEVPPANAQK